MVKDGISTQYAKDIRNDIYNVCIDNGLTNNQIDSILVQVEQLIGEVEYLEDRLEQVSAELDLIVYAGSEDSENYDKEYDK